MPYSAGALKIGNWLVCGVLIIEPRGMSPLAIVGVKKLRRQEVAV